ncbi:hypothetical protein KIW84_043622 [Lathyrus oleraceus]|uniref:Putative plant transposon protein domain-containing protein n=1 Tax=Pisum sativum TaxID=3888 RepID=A0A9D4XE59_PEA|nr:hypothetical protein KIW84_043622 [Pisum sativum]
MPNAPTFPNLTFLFEVYAGKYLKLVDYHIVRERAFALDDLQEFYANAAFDEVRTYTSYVRGKYIDYSPSAINSLFNFQHPYVCALVNYRHEHKVINEEMAQVMLDTFCRPWAKWVVERGLALRLKTAEFHQIPRAWASFFMQTLEVASNQS